MIAHLKIEIVINHSIAVKELPTRARRFITTRWLFFAFCVRPFFEVISVSDECDGWYQNFLFNTIVITHGHLQMFAKVRLSATNDHNLPLFEKLLSPLEF